MRDRLSSVELIGSEPEGEKDPRMLELHLEYKGAHFLLLIATPEEIIRRVRENLQLKPGERHRTNIMPTDDLDPQRVLEEVKRTSPRRLEKYWSEIPEGN